VLSLSDFVECPDVLEPVPGHPGLLAMCTYQLHSNGRKTGSVSLLGASQASLRHLGPPVETRAIFDGRWCSFDTEIPLFLAATQGPGLTLHSLSDEGPPTLTLVGAPWQLPPPPDSAAPVDNSSSSALCSVWLSAPGGGGEGFRCASGLSDGRVWLGCVPGDGGSLKTEACWESHSLQGTPMEVWCAAAVDTGEGCAAAAAVAGGGGGSSAPGRALWTGGDDGCLRFWDIRTAPPQPRSPPLSRAHTAGVTSIAPHPSFPFLVATGGYDERLLLWDPRKMSPAGTPLGEFNLGGGVWRLAWGDKVGRPDALAAACMYGGARVISAISESGGGRVTSEFHGHDSASLTYGVSWVEDDLVATCAFYSKEVKLWSPSSNAPPKGLLPM